MMQNYVNIAIMRGGYPMEKKFVLPFDINVYTKMYHHLAFPLGIVMGNAEKDITPWLCDKFINVRYFESNPNTKFDIVFGDKWFGEKRILFKQNIILDRYQYQIFDIDIVNIMRRMINQEYYIHGRYNEQYISGKASYNKNYFFHDYLLIGFDDNKECFISVGYLNDGRFQEYQIPYESMRKSITSIANDNIYIGFIGYDREFDFHCNLHRVRVGLYNYLHSISDTVAHSGDCFGLDAMKHLILDFERRIAEKRSLDIRFTRGVMEHKFIMHLRFRYLLNNGYIKSKLILDMAKRVYDMSEKIHMLALKYNITQNANTAESVISLLRETINEEERYIPLLLKELGEYDV